MKNLIRFEELALFALAIYLNSFLPFPTWLFWALFLVPDIGMLGYLVNSKVGAITYNILHHKGIAVACYFLGYYLIIHELTFVGVLLLGHSSFDRIFGYGLKYPDAFNHTHLGVIGKNR
ncbi:MAG: DUF4260 domain-containing protein [Cyclobacteriaceae bacterium]|nr:DUF4260 domain-containing protein [Cyclobacteriaceae bacterium]